MKRILVIGTGGTIACRRTSDGLMPMISSDEILACVPHCSEFCTMKSRQIMNIDSTNMQPSDWLRIARVIEEQYENYDGFVITHGTDTLAYTAAALSYLICRSPKPIVVTGAQRPINLEDTDARVNLSDSLLFASSDLAHDVSIVFDGKVIAGTRAKKERSKSYDAFSSINFPCIAVIRDQRILFYLNDKEEAPNVPVFSGNLDTKVGLLKLIPSMDASILRYMGENYDAVIIESFGVGGLPSCQNNDFRNAVAALTDHGKTVVMATQVTNEGSNMSLYEVGRRIKRDYGLLETCDMTLEAAVTKLMWILGQTRRPDEIRRLFYQTVNHDIIAAPDVT